MPREKLKEKITDVDALFCLLRDKIDKEILDAGAIFFWPPKL